MAGLAGLGVGGAVGGLVGALIGMGIPEYEAKRYEGRVKDGGNLLSVHCDNSEEIKRAKDLLKASGAQDIASSGESSAAKDSDARYTAGARTDADYARKDPLSTRDPGVPTDPREATDRRDPDPLDPSRPRIRP
jgi:hypothetical protein